MESAAANRGAQQSLPFPTVASLGSLEGEGMYLWKGKERIGGRGQRKLRV